VKIMELTFKILKTTRASEFGFWILTYMCVLIIFTDCIVWLGAGSLNGMSWKKLALYSVFAQPLWSFLAVKGVLKEQAELINSERWNTLDTLPMNPLNLSILFHAAQTFKSKSLVVWLSFLFLTGLYLAVPWYFIPLSLLAIFVGTIFLCIASYFFILIAPKGYSSVVSSIFTSICYVLAGSVIPWSIVPEFTWLQNLNPVSLLVSVPLEFLVEESFSFNTAKMFSLLKKISIGIVWISIFAISTNWVQSKYRARLYS
jgi:hypothetical protein